MFNIQIPTVTVTGKTFTVSNDSWKVEYVRTTKPTKGEQPANSKIAAANFRKVLKTEFKAINEGRMPKHIVMKKYTDQGFFEMQFKLDDAISKHIKLDGLNNNNNNNNNRTRSRNWLRVLFFKRVFLALSLPY